MRIKRGNYRRYEGTEQYVGLPVCCGNVCPIFCTGIYAANYYVMLAHGDKAVGIEKVMTWIAIIGTVMLFITFLTTKERIVPKPEQKSTSTGFE